MPLNSKRSRKTLRTNLKGQDCFGSAYRMNINETEKQLKSYSGACCSLFLAIVTLIYAFQKGVVLMERSDFDIKQSEKAQWFTDQDVFSYENGFNIAVGLTAYDNEKEWILDPTYGELIIQRRGWGTKADGTFGKFSTSMQTHVCTRDELGLDEDRSQAKFMPIAE